MNNINFTGLKNIGGCATIIERANGMYKVKENYLIVHLTDDYNGKDLSEFNDTVKKCQPKISGCTNKDDNRFVHVMTRTVRNMQDEFDRPIPQLFVNGKEIPAERETIPMFSYIAKLTRRIAAIDKNEIKYDMDFKYGEAGNTYLFPYVKLDDIAQELNYPAIDLIDNVYSADSSKKYAKMIHDDVHKKMLDYLG